MNWLDRLNIWLEQDAKAATYVFVAVLILAAALAGFLVAR